MPNSKPLALIDIGSNSIRLVIYDGLKRSPIPLFNEKVLCGLAKNLDTTGCLNSEGVEPAFVAIRRFVSLAQAMRVETLQLFATSAVRDAKDGNDFVKRIKDELRTEITIFPEEMEAKYAGTGILASVNKPCGIVGDLGGGSLELVNIENNALGTGVSFPIGPLRFADINSNRKDISDTIARYIKKFPLKKYLPDNSFYAVGGAFRNMAKVHMGRKNYPLKVIHNYAVDAEDMMTTAEVISRMSEESLTKIHGISKKRAGSLPFAALILKNVIEIGNPKQVVFSTSGVREGLLYSQLSDDLKVKDPLICGATEIMSRMHRNAEYGHELASWMQPLFLNGETENEKRLRLAACIMSEISAYENTEYRAELAYRKILDSSLIGLDHTERVFIATALYCRYSSFNDDNILATMGTLLSSKKVQNAQIIGTAMRLARTISGSSTSVLDKTKLKLTKNILYLNMSKGASDLYGESLQKRFQQLAEILGREARIG